MKHQNNRKLSNWLIKNKPPTAMLNKPIHTHTALFALMNEVDGYGWTQEDA